MALVNSYFQRGTPVANNDWTGGVYMAGNMAHYRALREASVLQYAEHWGDAHKWNPTGYRGCNGDLGCPDNIAAGMGYTEIYEATSKRNVTMVAGIVRAIETAITHNACNIKTNSSQAKDSDHCWWWLDALFMALPTYAKVGNLIGDTNSTLTSGRIWDAARANYNITA